MPEKIDDAEREEATNTPILIKTYGEFWDSELVNWNNKWYLLGRRSRKGKDINVYEERGVYVLYKDYLPVYVGKADVSSIGYRLQLHRNSWRKGPRWDRFSWFGIMGLNDKDKLRRRRKTRLRVTTDELIATLEALLIVTIDPRLNSRRENFKNAVRLFQSDTHKPIDVAEHLESIQQKLEKLLALQASN